MNFLKVISCFDKLEKANYFLENILATLDEESDSRIISWLVDSPIQDGGQWDMFVNLMEKYGIVPQSAMPESHSSNSRSMNQIITRHSSESLQVFLRFESQGGVDIKDLRKEEIRNDANYLQYGTAFYW